MVRESVILRDYRERLDSVFAKKIPRTKSKNGHGLPWEFIDARKYKTIYQFAYRIPHGYSANDVLGQLDAFYANVGAVVEIQDRGGVVHISIIPDDFPDFLPVQQEGLYEKAKGKKVLLGLNRLMEGVYHSFEVNAHLGIGGMPGYGKTAIIRNILYQLVKISPAFIEIYIIDLKMYSYMAFQDCPQIRGIATNLNETLEVLESIWNEMQRRGQEVLDHGNRQAIQRFHWIVLVIDEMAQLSAKLAMGDEKKTVQRIESLLTRLTCLGRESGLSCVLCTQSPDSETINGQIRRNLTAAIGVRTNDHHSSSIIIKEPGLERLSKPGRAIYKTNEKIHLIVPHIGVHRDGKMEPAKKHEEDNAWTELLKPFYQKGALKFVFTSRRRSQNRNTNPNQDGIETDDFGNNETFASDRHRSYHQNDSKREGKPQKKIIRNVEGIAKRKTYRKQAEGNRQSDGSPSIEQRPGTHDDRPETDSFE